MVNPVVILIREKKKERIQEKPISGMKKGIAIDFIDIKRIKMKHYE